MAFSDLREFLDYLEGQPGELVRIPRPLKARFEISAVLKEVSAGPGPVLYFERVEGHAVPVVGNVLGTWRRLALALGNSKEDPFRLIGRRRGRPVRPRLVRKAPVQEVVLTRGIDLLKALPVLTYHEKDAGPYLTAGIVMAKDPKTGRRSMGIHRLQVQGKDQLGILIASPPLSELFAEAEATGRPLPVGIALGVDPVLMVGSVVKASPGMDKVTHAGGLRGSPVELVRCQTVECEVPARAEVVIEGRVLPGRREREGPFGESTGYYLAYDCPVIEVTAITHRKGPIYQVIQPWSAEDDLLISVAYGPEMLGRLKAQDPDIQDLWLVPGTCGTHAVLSLRKRRAGHGRDVLALALGLFPHFKRVVVVDEDVDLRDPREVEWALATRFQGDRDLLTLSGATGFSIDPTAEREGADFRSAKLGLDATKPLNRAEDFARIAHPRGATEKARGLLRDLGLAGEGIQGKGKPPLRERARKPGRPA